MTSNSFDREKQILDYLRENQSASIQQLAEAFGVSNMTIHRGLNKLAQNGQVQKKHGGVVLAHASVEDAESACVMCGKTTSQRTVFIVKLEGGEEERACCAHCGLMLQSRERKVWQSLTVDCLHGHIISAGQAYYLAGSDLNLCCVPSVLAFGSKTDAEKFQKGFGGRLLNMNETIQYLQELSHM
jgi:transcription elongation factor Elf1